MLLSFRIICALILVSLIGLASPAVLLDVLELSKIPVDHVRTVSFLVFLNQTSSESSNVSNRDESIKVQFSVRSLEPEGTKVAEMVPKVTTFVLPQSGSLNNSVDIKTHFLGFFEIDVTLVKGTNVLESYSFPGSVVRQRGAVDIIMTVIIVVIVFVTNANMGCQLDLKVIKETLRRPVGPVIGLLCQFIVMPLASYSFGYLFLRTRTAWRLGLFLYGCSPGGSASNFWTLILKGDLNLSITMTVISTAASIGMMPFWVFTLGSQISSENNFQIPYYRLLSTLLTLISPLFIGIAVKRYRPKWAEFSRKIIRPFTVAVLVFMFVFTATLYNFMFRMFTWKIALVGLCIAWTGYGLGALAAFACQLKKEQIIAVSIETAFQNMGIPFLVLQLTLGFPEADLGTAPMVAQMLVTSQPLWLFYFFKVINDRCLKSKPVASEPSDETANKARKPSELSLISKNGIHRQLNANGDAENGSVST